MGGCINKLCKGRKAKGLRAALDEDAACAASDDKTNAVSADKVFRSALTQCKAEDFLEVPQIITFSDGQAIRRLAQSMVSDIATHDSQVFISYATGHRDGDAEGFGPGTYYATAILKAFHDAGIQCFSGLMIPTGMNWEIFCAQLSSRFTTCRILLVLQTKALYSSKPCLKEIYAAQKSKIAIIPVRFELDLPPIDEQWTKIKKTDLDDFLMLTEVQNEYCQLEAVPEARKTILSDARKLDDLVADVKQRLSDASGVVRHQQKIGDCPQQPDSVQRSVSSSGEKWKLANFVRGLSGSSTLLSPGQKPHREAKFRHEKKGEVEVPGGHYEIDFTQPIAHTEIPTSQEDGVESESKPLAPDGDKRRVFDRKRPKSSPPEEVPNPRNQSPSTTPKVVKAPAIFQELGRDLESRTDNPYSSLQYCEPMNASRNSTQQNQAKVVGRKRPLKHHSSGPPVDIAPDRVSRKDKKHGKRADGEDSRKKEPQQESSRFSWPQTPEETSTLGWV